ncbi:hypothetical protein, partial [Hahella ganghwensis]|uniref:hypothetical protein n=1 Tax=Hahella ganghwensis TaxID=286420 RepID=UPI000526B5AE
RQSYFNSYDEAQEVLDAVHSGAAQVLGKTKNGNVLVKYDGVQGMNNNIGAGYIDQPTNIFMIKGTKNPAVVPTSPQAVPARVVETD